MTPSTIAHNIRFLKHLGKYRDWPALALVHPHLPRPLKNLSPGPFWKMAIITFFSSSLAAKPAPIRLSPRRNKP
jgi:hypothetical protein